MEIRISRSGGFAGVEEELAHLDTTELDAARAAAVEGRLAEIGFFALPGELPGGSVGADQFTYSVEVTGEGGSHTVSYRDDSARSPAAGPAAAVADLVDLVLRR